MAKACRGFLTTGPPLPLCSWPCLNSRITVATFLSALLCFFIGPPRGFDLHCTTQQLAFASLLLWVNGMVDDNWQWGLGLGSMPVRFGLIQLLGQRLLKPPLPDGLLQPPLP